MRPLLAIMLVMMALLRPVAAQDSVVGFAMILVPDGAAATTAVGVWYPAEDATPRPTSVGSFTQDLAPGAAVRGRALALIVVSHGSGGFFASHADTALTLAQAGFIVAALTHTGDNYRDSSGATDLAARTRQLAAVVGFLTDDWRPGAVDANRIGAFGHSAGAFTVLSVAGGQPDLGRIGPHCAANPEFFDCRLMSRAAVPSEPPVLARAPRPLRAIVVAAPALGFTFGAGSLAQVAMPVQLWQAGMDRVLPAPFYVEPVRAALPQEPEFHSIEDAGHFDFLAPCTEALAHAAPVICTSAEGFDRATFHARFNADVVRFMSEAMRP